MRNRKKRWYFRNRNQAGKKDEILDKKEKLKCEIKNVQSEKLYNKKINLLLDLKSEPSYILFS